MPDSAKYWRFASVIIAGVVATGCSTWSERSGVEVQRVAGLLENRESQWQLQPCDGDNALVVSDEGELQTLFERVAQPGQTAIFADLEGRVRADWSMSVQRILRMESTGLGCATQAAAGEHWIAEGLNRDWRVVIDRQGMEFTDEQNQSAGPVGMIAEQLPDGSMSFRAEQDSTLELWLYPQPCFDYSNDFRHLRATLVINGKRMNGCAFEGTATP